MLRELIECQVSSFTNQVSGTQSLYVDTKGRMLGWDLSFLWMVKKENRLVMIDRVQAVYHRDLCFLSKILLGSR